MPAPRHSASRDAIGYEPFSEQARRDPYPAYRRLREHAPVYWAQEAHGWVISRYDDVQLVLRRPDLFSSDAMRTMLMGVRPGSAPDPARLQQWAEMAARLPFPPGALATTRNLIVTDPPDHDAMRRIVNRGFTPRRIAALEPRVREIVDRAVAGLWDADTFDLVRDLAVPVPVVVIAELLGVGRDRLADFKHWSDGIIAGVTGSGRGKHPMDGSFGPCMIEFARHLAEIVEQRRRTPRDDLIGALLDAEGGEAALTAAEVVMFGVLLLIAGNETTTNLIGNAVDALLAHPDQLERVRRDRRLVPGLVEEALRYDAPIQFVVRRATRDVQVAGRTLPRDAMVVALLGSANRDDRRFPRGDTFDVTRDTAGHLAFGFGVHFCLGASLARLEARVALEALVDLLPHVARRDAELEYVDSFLVRGPRRLELARVA